MQQVNGVPVLSSDPVVLYEGLEDEPTWFSAQGGVYKCIERSTNKEVAIKKYLVEENQHEDMFVMPKDLVENEIYSMTKCVHPNILKLYAVHLHEEFVYLIMPLCTGGSLQHYVFEHHLTIGQLVYIITSIASGLAKVHSHGYIHRDIKCDNIFLDQETNSIVIGDFGVVSISPAADSSIEEAGVVLFWSPELVQQKIVNHKVDIWALGIVILEILNGGKAPYEDEKLDEDMIKQRILDTGRPLYPPNLPSSLVDLIDHCLDPDPRARWSANSLLEHPFLKEYPAELLFPANRIDSDVSSQSETDILDSLQDEPIQYQKVSLEEIQFYDHESATILPLPDTISINNYIPPSDIIVQVSCKHTPGKCRLPVPAFSVDKQTAVAESVQVKIANIIRKRQFITQSNRSQGSRIPMLCIVQPIVHTTRTTPKSVTTSPPIKDRTKTRTRTESTLKSHKLSKHNPVDNKRPEKTKTTPKKKKELPPKCSIFRQKKPTSPATDSRTARLMMGVSTGNRRQSFKEREDKKDVSPTLGNRFGKLFTHDSKRRPMSVVASSSSTSAIRSDIPQPTRRALSSLSSEEMSSRRRSAPIPPQNMEDKKAHSIKSGIKALRVY